MERRDQQLALKDDAMTDDAEALEKLNNSNMEFERNGRRAWMDDEEDLRKNLMSIFASIGVTSFSKYGKISSHIMGRREWQES